MSLLDKLMGLDDDENYADVKTMFGRATVYDVETDEGRLLRVLDVDGTWQSACYADDDGDALAFGYHQQFDRAFSVPTDANRILMLGGGAFAYPRHVVANHNQVQVDAVEIDPAIIALAKQWFFFDRLAPQQQVRLHLICDDAVNVLQTAVAQGEHYDVVVNDLFAAQKPTEFLMTEQGARTLCSILAPDGLYVANVVSAIKGRKASTLRTVKAALATAFSQVAVISLGEDAPRTPDNNVVFATNADYSLEEALGIS